MGLKAKHAPKTEKTRGICASKSAGVEHGVGQGALSCAWVRNKGGAVCGSLPSGPAKAPVHLSQIRWAIVWSGVGGGLEEQGWGQQQAVRFRGVGRQ